MYAVWAPTAVIQVCTALAMNSGPLSEEVQSNLEHKVSSEILLILEMARNLAISGEALIKQAELVMSRIPSWDEP